MPPPRVNGSRLLHPHNTDYEHNTTCEGFKMELNIWWIINIKKKEVFTAPILQGRKWKPFLINITVTANTKRVAVGFIDKHEYSTNENIEKNVLNACKPQRKQWRQF